MKTHFNFLSAIALLAVVYVQNINAQNVEIVSDINQVGSSNNSNPMYDVVFNNKLYFQANDGVNGSELWVYDGVNPPSMVADIYIGANSSSPQYLTV
ncbi:MAG: hypothetical protein HGB12_13245, partial [Bacteroidetes bacterium]|nr:hypothetical protein [Bacteroidota bacterium]